MLYYTGFLVLAAFVSGTLGSVHSGGIAAAIMRASFIVSFLLFTISLGLRNKARA